MLRRFLMWLRGDDGQVYGIITEPSPFRVAESRCDGPFTRRQAKRHARRFVARNPYGEATIIVGPSSAKWPPPLNWQPSQ